MQNGKFDIVNGKTKPLFLRYCIPNILGILALSSAQLIDAFFIGNYAGGAALASINLVLPFFSLIMGLGIMLCTGGSVICATFIGEKDYRNASKIFSKVIICNIMFCLMITTLGVLFPQQIVKMLGANGELLSDSANYLFYVSIFITFFLGSYCLSVFARVEQRPVLAFSAILIGTSVNIVLDWVLIFKLHFGVKGAAIATGMSQAVTFFIIFSHFFSKRSGLRFIMKGLGSWKDIAGACYNGMSELVDELSIGITTFIFNWIMITNLGTIGVAAYTVINYSIFFGTMVAYGIGDSIVPLISTNLGAGKLNRVSGFLRISLFSGIGLGVSIFAALIVMPETFVNFFLGKDSLETKLLALEFIDLLKWGFLFSSISIILSAYFTAIQRPLESAVVALSRSLIFPVVFLMLMPKVFDTDGIFMSIPMAELVTIIISLTLLSKNKPQKLIGIDEGKNEIVHFQTRADRSQYSGNLSGTERELAAE